MPESTSTTLSGPDGPVPQRTLTSLRGPEGPRGELAKAIPRRPRVSWWLGIVFAFVFTVLVTPSLTADRWLGSLGAGTVKAKTVASLTVRVPPMAGFDTPDHQLHIGDGGILIARGHEASAEDERNAKALAEASPSGALPYVALFLLTFVLAAIFTHHMRRSVRGRLVRVQIVSLVAIAILAALVKIMLLMTAISVLVVPVALLAMLPTLALDRITGLATGILAALVVALLGPFDVGVAIVMLVQAAVAGLVVAEQPKARFRAVLTAGVVTTLFTAATYLLLTYLTTGRLPVLRDPLHSAWFAAAIGPAIATVLAVPLLPLYQLLVGEITRGKLIELEDLSNPLLKQIAEKAPGTWQHSLMMANLAEIAANAIGASGRLVRVGAYYHDLGKSLQPKYFIENLDPGETSPHDQLPPEVSCDAIFAHVTEGIVAARKAGLHERIVDFMHMHHGNGVLEYFWGKTKEQGNPKGFSIEQFRYPGHPPQSRETAILAICDAVEAASRTLKKPDAASIDSLVQRIVYGKLHLGQLDESGLSMSDLRQISDSLRETIRHANHGRIEYPWQKAQQDASASKEAADVSTNPRLDSLDRSPAQRETSVKAQPPSASGSGATSGQTTNEVAFAATADQKSAQTTGKERPQAKTDRSDEDAGILETAPALVKEVQPARQSGSYPIVTPVVPPSRETIQGIPPAEGGRRRTTSPPFDPLRGGQPPADARAKRASTQPPPIPPMPQRATSEPPIELVNRRDTSSPPLGDSAASSGPTTRRGSAPPPVTDAPPPAAEQTSHGHASHRDSAPKLFEHGEPASRDSAPKLFEHGEPASRDSAPQIGNRRPTQPPPDGLIGPAMFGEHAPAARKRAATLPPTRLGRAPTVPPPLAPLRRPATIPPLETRTAGPPVATDLDNAVTNPPPLRNSGSPIKRLPPFILEERPTSTPHEDVTMPAMKIDLDDDARVTGERAAVTSDDEARRTQPSMPAIEDAGRTEPSMPRFEMPVTKPGQTQPGTRPPPPPPKPLTPGLAARIDAQLDDDAFGTETPIRAPTAAELRALLGQPDPTKQQSLDDLERLHAEADALRQADEDARPEILSRRSPRKTAEVDDDDIEAAIEVAPPARRPNAIAVAKPKKSE
jgi:putative nucleotidyltransferase with HDIG domain